MKNSFPKNRLVRSQWNLILLPALFLFLAFCVQAAPATQKPNILLLLADNWAWPHAGICGDKVISTPVFDRVATNGFLFRNTFCLAPSCSPARASLLTGQTIHQLAEGANLWGTLPRTRPFLPELLEADGYFVGSTGKGWGPGKLEAEWHGRNPAGPTFKNPKDFLSKVPKGKPFFLWFGSHDPHRPYVPGSGAAAGMKPENVEVPPYLPDTPEVRNDILDYYAKVQRFDRECGEILQQLEKQGLLENTLIVMTSDNGWQMPRGLANIYDSGTRIPLAVWWPAKKLKSRVIDGFINLDDFAPTFLEAAGLKPLPEMTGRSFLPLMQGQSQPERDRVFLERERHANVRKGDLSYPCRAIRTERFLYIRNLFPDRWPAGDPETYWAVGPFGDIDPSPTKELIMTRRGDSKFAPYFDLSFGKRPAEELYDLQKDPFEINNVASQKKYARTKRRLARELDDWMEKTADPRALKPQDKRWDCYPYFGQAAKKP